MWIRVPLPPFHDSSDSRGLYLSQVEIVRLLSSPHAIPHSLLQAKCQQRTGTSNYWMVSLISMLSALYVLLSKNTRVPHVSCSQMCVSKEIHEMNQI